MKITTKYDLGDEVWYMDNNRPQCKKVTYAYIILADRNQYEIRYLVGDEDVRRPEETLYRTKKELLATL